MKRNVIEINEDKCVGCGLCAGACMQGAIQIVNGKAKLMSESYCDGLGMCLPKCPVDAIKLVEKETDAFDESRKNIKAKKAQPSVISIGGTPAADQPMGCGCPGSAQKAFDRKKPESSLQVLSAAPMASAPSASTAPQHAPAPVGIVSAPIGSELMQWPVQLRLISPNAPVLQNADLLIAADCTAFAYGDFHRDFIRGKVTVIACPKLDDNQANKEKLIQILSSNSIKSITVVRMQVPCCGGIIQATRDAMLESHTIVPYSEVIISTDGQIIR